MSPSIRARRAIAKLGRLEADAALAQRRLVARVRREILAEIAHASTFRRWQLGQLLDAVDRFIAEASSTAESAVAGYATEAWGAGVEIVLAGSATAAGQGGGLAGISRSLLAAILDHTRSEVHDVWAELGSKLVSTIRRTALGIDDPFKAMQKLARTLLTAKTFESKFARAEAIVRTELNRTFSISSATRAEEAKVALERVGSRMTKSWLDSHDTRVRPDHEQAGKDYTQAKAIPVDEPFVVGGEPLRFPLDPQASAKQTVQCRCVALYHEVLA